MAKKKKEEIIRRTIGDLTTISVSSTVKDKLDLLKVGRKIPKYDLDNEIRYHKYSHSDIIYDLLYIYQVVVEGIKNDPELENQYPYKTYKPYFIVKFFYQIGMQPQDFDGLEDLGVEDDEGR